VDNPIIEKGINVLKNNKILLEDNCELSQETKVSLERLQDYELPDGVYERLKQKPPFNKMPEEEIRNCVEEFKKFISLLVINRDNNRRLEMISPVIDEIWHSFILFTKEYREFCGQVIGEYIHHEPDVQDGASQDALRNSNFQSIRNFHEDYQKYFGELSSIWSLQIDSLESSEPDNKILNKSVTVKQILAVGVLLLVDILMSMVLTFDFSVENGKVLNYIIPIFFGIVTGGVFLDFAIKDQKIRKIIIAGIFVMLETLIIFAFIFSLLCKNGPMLDYLLAEALFLLVNSIILVAVLVPSKFKGGSGKNGGCGGGAFGGCGSGGAGCGGGGCGGGC